MRLLIVDHNALDELARRLYEALAEQWQGSVSLLVPERWHDGYRMQRFVASVRKTRLEIFPSRVFLPQRTHRMVFLDLARVLSRLEPDLLFINAEPENFQTWHAARLARRRSAMKFVFSSWRNIDHRVVGYPYRWAGVHRKAEGEVLARADHGIAFTSKVAEIYERYGFSQMKHIPPCVDTAVFFPAVAQGERERLGLTEFTVGFVGRLVQGKAVDDLFHASALCRVPHQLLIVGEGPERSRLRTLARELEISDHVVWAGSLSHKRVPSYLDAMDALVLPSRTERFWKEQFGRVLIEAMACRVPVIGSSSGAIPSVIGNAGVVVEEGNPHALAAALTRLYDDAELRKDLAERGFRRVSERYALPVVATQYRALFASLLESPHN